MSLRRSSHHSDPGDIRPTGGVGQPWSKRRNSSSWNLAVSPLRSLSSISGTTERSSTSPSSPILFHRPAAVRSSVEDVSTMDNKDQNLLVPKARAKHTRSTRAVMQDRAAVLDKLTDERNLVLNGWADPDVLGLMPQEVAINAYLRSNIKFLFGETGFDPRVNARNPVSVNMHNPRFAAALWAVNTEGYRRKGSLSRSQKEVIALGVSLANNCPHCAFTHTALGAAAGSDISFDNIQHFYQTGDADSSFPTLKGKDPLIHDLASWAIKHRDGRRREKRLPCTAEQLPEALGTMMLFSILNRVTDAFVSKIEAGPMFPLPVRAMMKFQSMPPVLQRMASSMMSIIMHNEDAKVKKGQVLKDINKITPIVKGIEEESDGDASVNLPEEIAWAESNDMVKMVVSFLSTEAELMATMFVPHPLRAFMRSWVSKWDGEKAPEISREKWLRPVVMGSGLQPEEMRDVPMLRVMLVTVVASFTMDDKLLSECQELHGIRGTHAAVLWAAYLAAQRVCQLAVTSP